LSLTNGVVLRPLNFFFAFALICLFSGSTQMAEWLQELTDPLGSTPAMHFDWTSGKDISAPPFQHTRRRPAYCIFVPFRLVDFFLCQFTVFPGFSVLYSLLLRYAFFFSGDLPHLRNSLRYFFLHLSFLIRCSELTMAGPLPLRPRPPNLQRIPMQIYRDPLLSRFRTNLLGLVSPVRFFHFCPRTERLVRPPIFTTPLSGLPSLFPLLPALIQGRQLS